MHRTTLGDFELTVVSDGTYFLDGGAFFGVVPKTMWSKKVATDEQNRLDAGLNSLLVRTGKKNILIETGIGNKLSEKMVHIYKQPAKLLDNLHAVGYMSPNYDPLLETGQMVLHWVSAYLAPPNRLFTFLMGLTLAWEGN